MGFFNNKRADGVIVKDNPYGVIMPFVMPKRTESVVFYELDVNIENLRKYMHARRREGKEISLFNIVIAAAVKTFGKYPKANRFIAGKRVYQRNKIEICYVVKREMTQEAEETTVKLVFDPSDSIDSVSEKMNDVAAKMRAGEMGGDDELAGILAHMPRFLVTAFVGFIRWLDFHGALPSMLRDELPFWCSLFVTNTGSIGLGAPLHHLYEIGTCSMFLSIGRIDKNIVIGADGKPKNTLSVSFGFSIDERILDGFNFSKIIAHFSRLLQNPDEIDAD